MFIYTIYIYLYIACLTPSLALRVLFVYYFRRALYKFDFICGWSRVAWNGEEENRTLGIFLEFFKRLCHHVLVIKIVAVRAKLVQVHYLISFDLKKEKTTTTTTTANVQVLVLIHWL